jgi:hypothetical protein
MAVSKLDINSIYSPFDNRFALNFPFKNRTPMANPNIRSTIKTIFNHFRNKHARDVSVHNGFRSNSSGKKLYKRFLGESEFGKHAIPL